MPNNIDVNIQGRDNLTPAMAQARRKTEAEANKLRNNVQSQFRQLGQNILSQVGGPLGMLANQLGGIQHPLGVLIGGVTALGGAFLSLSKRAAEANAAVSTDSQSLLVGFENLKERISDNLNIIGGQGISVFNKFFDLIGVGATKQQLLNEQIKRQNEIIINTVKSTDEYIGKLKEFLIASDRLAASTLARDYFEAVAKGSTSLANSYFRQITNLQILQGRYKNMTEDVKTLTTEQKKLNTALDTTNTLALQGAALGELDKSYEEFTQRLTEIFGKIQAINEAQNESEASQARSDFIDAHNAKLQQQKDLYQQIGQNVRNMVANLAHALIFSQDIGDVIKSTIASFFQLAISRYIPIPPGANGIVAMQSGSIVRRPTPALIGEAGPEAVVPLSPNKARQRQEIMDAAGLSGGAVTLNISMPNIRSIDPVTVRNVLLPEFNRQIRRGEKLLASKLR